jgi:hypothetical protein
MTYSSTFVEALVSQNTDEVFLFLLTLSHPDLSTPIRVVNNVENITSRSLVYQAFPFELILPQDDGDSLPQVVITLSNVSLEFIDEIRALNGALDVKLEVILASSPNTVEMSIDGMKTYTISYDTQSIQATCQVEDVLNMSFPNELYMPSNFPGLFV